MELHQKHYKVLSEEDQPTDNQWFEDADHNFFSFKHCVYNVSGLEKIRRIKILHLNLQQSQEAPADHQKQGQHHHQSYPQRKNLLRKKCLHY